MTTATCPFCVRWVQIGSFPAIQKQTYRKTDLMRPSERQMDARIGIFGSSDGIECIPETFDRVEYRSYLIASDLAMQTASRAHVSECAAPAIRTCQKGAYQTANGPEITFLASNCCSDARNTSVLLPLGLNYLCLGRLICVAFGVPPYTHKTNPGAVRCYKGG